MKKFWCVLCLSILVLFAGGCKRENPVEPPQSENSAGIFLKVNGVALPDSSVMEKRTQYIFQLTASFGVKAWTTTFGDDGSSVNGDIVQHAFRADTASTITIVAIDLNNIVHQKIYKVTLVSNISSPSVIWVSKKDLGNGSYEETFLYLKEILQDLIGPPGYTGNVTNPTWITTKFVDTNKIFSNGTVGDPPSGERGTYLMAKFTLIPNPYDLGIGKIDPATNLLIWKEFDGPYADGNHVKFTVTANGDVTPGGKLPNVEPPGDIGDTGPNAVNKYRVRDSTKLVILINNFTPWVSGSSFIRFQNSTGLFIQPVLQSAVTGYSGWGKFEIMAKDIPTDGKLLFHYGNQISNPLGFNPNAKKSAFYSEASGVLKVIIKKVGLGKRVAGSGIQYWTVSIEK